MIRKQFYDMISRAQLKSNLRHKFDFLLGLPLFRYVNKFKIESFVYFIEEITCNYNSVLYR